MASCEITKSGYLTILKTRVCLTAGLLFKLIACLFESNRQAELRGGQSHMLKYLNTAGRSKIKPASFDGRPFSVSSD